MRGGGGGGGGGASPHFSRMFNDWELEEVERFFLIFHNKKVLHTLDEKIVFLERLRWTLFSQFCLPPLV